MPSPLDKILTGIGRAAREAQAQVEQAYQANLGSFFDFSEPGNVKPHMIALALPDGKGGWVSQEVPLFTLVPHNAMLLDQLRVRMKVVLSHGNDDSIETDFSTAGISSLDLAEVEIVLKSHEMAEGLARVNDKLVKFV